MYAKGGEDRLEGGVEAGRKAAEDYTANRYHKPGDEFDAGWNMEGVMQDLEALHGVGHALRELVRVDAPVGGLGRELGALSAHG